MIEGILGLIDHRMFFMSVTIRQIYIENFRSIHKISILAKPLSVFVGKNDCGKSNILRALNLFFNGVTSPNKAFTFGDDYNLFVPERAKVAKEVIVRVELNIPQTYWETNGQVIVWEKRWRLSGEHSNKYWGVRLSKNRRGREVRNDVEIPEKSNVHTLLRQIEFQYVPAIKDAHYFDWLRGRIYSTIAEVATRTFRTSSGAFEASIGEHLEDLTAGIGQALKFDTRLALPRDLSHIFERLDFLSGEKSISLDHRGDGIKTRHIPMILEFMANKKRSLQGRGAMPHSFIWAYEEPENNLEFKSAVQLGDQLKGFAASDVAQILLTTHSPVFYDLASDGDANVMCCHVFRDTDLIGTQASRTTSEVDEKMGTMALLAPRVKGLVQDVRNQVESQVAAETLAAENRSKIFVEGESDRIILQHSLNVFFPHVSDQIDIVTKLSGAGHGYVIDMLNAWRAQHKHYPSRPRAAGLLDCDAAKLKNDWNALTGNITSAKCFCYPKPDHSIAALKAGFQLEVTLEVLYELPVWQWAKAQGYLEARKKTAVYSERVLEQMLAGQVPLDLPIDPSYECYVSHNFVVGSKIITARHVIELAEGDFKRSVPGLEAKLTEVLQYLGIIHPI